MVEISKLGSERTRGDDSPGYSPADRGSEGWWPVLSRAKAQTALTALGRDRLRTPWVIQSMVRTREVACTY